MNLPATIVFVWHMPILIILTALGLLGRGSTPPSAPWIVGGLQFFVLFWVAGYILQAVFTRRET